MTDSSLVITWVLYVCILILLLSLGGNIQEVIKGATLPWFYPPGWIFGLVWTTLFALFFVVLAQASNVQRVIGLVYFALVLTWTPVFVYTKRFDFSFYYLLFVLILTIAFGLYVQSWYFVPQMIWITLATGLSFGLYYLN